MSRKLSQSEKVRSHLEAGKSLTEATAEKRYGVKNLSARICELRQEGLNITTNLRKRDGRQFASYTL